MIFFSAPAQVMNVAADRINGTAMNVSWKPLTLEEAQGFFSKKSVYSVMIVFTSLSLV